MSNAQMLSSAQQSALSALFAKLPPDKATALNTADPVHRAGIDAALTFANRTPQRYPALHAALAKGAAPDPAATLTLIDPGGRDRSGKATAMTWYTAGPNSLYAGGALFALDGDSGAVLAAGQNSNVGEGFVPISTDTATAKPAGKSLKVLSVNHTVSRTGAASFTALASHAGGFVDANITVEVPTPTPLKPPLVRIAVGRKTIDPTMDYTYTEPDNIISPYLIIPFKGNAILPYKIKGTLGQPIPNLQIVTVVFFKKSGGTDRVQLNTTYTKNLYGKVVLDGSNPNRMNWEYRYDSKSYNTTDSLVYNQEALVNEQESYFYFEFNVPILDGPGPTLRFAVCSKNTPYDPSWQCDKLPTNIYFWWHCLAAGTKVKLADGSEAAIETIANDHEIATGAGTTLRVDGTSRGQHKASKTDRGPHAVYRLRTDAGQELVGTGAHLIKTPSGFSPLCDLAAGDAVSTERGSARVAACEPVDWDGGFFDLYLDGGNDAAEKPNAARTYIANGVIVGDHAALKAEHRRRTRDVAYMTANLSGHVTTDYASAVADIQY